MPAEIDTDIPDVDADPFLRLLTDALRAGPASPEWASAVAEARGRGAAGGDDAAVLLAARERLAEGRAYRSVAAGPGFERRLMAKVDADANAKPRSLSAGWLAYLGAGLVVASVGVLLAILTRSGSGVGSGASDLAQAYFHRPFAETSLTGPLESGWRTIGSLPLATANRLMLTDAKLGPDYAGGGLVTRRGAAADEPLAVQATFHFGGHVGPGCVPQLFVADVNDFHGDRGFGSHELAWVVQDGQGQVAVADGTPPAPRLKVRPMDDVTVVIKLAPDGDAAVVCNDHVLWTGPSGLAPDKPRFAGVRLLYRGDARDAVAVTGLKVLQK
jgi:hypothetical protein